MKHPRKLTLKEKKILEQAGFDPDDFYRIKRTGKITEFLNEKTKEIVQIIEE